MKRVDGVALMAAVPLSFEEARYIEEKKRWLQDKGVYPDFPRSPICIFHCDCGSLNDCPVCDGHGKYVRQIYIPMHPNMSGALRYMSRWPEDGRGGD